MATPMEPLEMRRAGLTGCSGELQIVQIFKGEEHRLHLVFRPFSSWGLIEWVSATRLSEKPSSTQTVKTVSSRAQRFPSFLARESGAGQKLRWRWGRVSVRTRSVVTVPHKGTDVSVLCTCTVLWCLDHQVLPLPLRRSHLKRLSLWEAGMSAEHAVQEVS
ncbi:hypothetical protein BC567DRAFT_218822 [Phyllosticta citribraziliensis]